MEEPPLKKIKTSPEAIDEIIADRKDIVDLLSESEQNYMRELLLYSFVFPFCQHRDNYYDKLSILDCALEIIRSNVDNSKNAIKMCHEIQRSLSNDEIRSGWRVSFQAKGKSHRFFYLNDRIRERRSITFMCKTL